MPSYLIMGTFTDKGLENIEGTIERGDRFKEIAKECGVEIKELMWLMGEHDVFCLAEAQDDHTVCNLLLRAGSRGFVRTASHRAFSKDEMTKIVQAMK